MRFFTVDSIDNGFASVIYEDGRAAVLPLSRLPKGTREGDVIKFSRFRGYYKDADERKRREDRVKTLLDEIDSK